MEKELARKKLRGKIFSLKVTFLTTKNAFPW